MAITPVIPGETVRTAYASAPQFVRDVFNSEETNQTIIKLQGQYKMHIDVVGELGKEVGYLLLGLTSPVLFLQRLVSGGLDETTALEITETVNREIFVPLREKMHANTSATQETKKIAETDGLPVTSMAPATSENAVTRPQLVTIPKPLDTTTSPLEIYSHLEDPVQTAVPVELNPTTPLTPPQVPVARTMAHDVEAMKDGHQPAAWAPPVPAQSPPPAFSVPTSFTQTPVATPVPQAVPAAPVFTPAPVPMSAPQAPRPAYVPPPINALRSEPTAPKQPSADTLPERKEITDTLKKYGIDPYHEPVD